jgi:cobalt-zinc-cadmium efflux system outer membrane protein
MKSLLRLSFCQFAATALAAASLTTDEAVRHAITHQPELAAARLLVTEAQGRREQAGRLANPTVQGQLQPNVRGREGTYTVAFVQQFPLTARLRHERAVSTQELAAVEAELREAERLLTREVRLRCVRWLALDAHRRLGEQHSAVATALARSARTAADRGEGSSLEAAQRELEASQLAQPQLHHDLERATLAGELRQLLGLPAEEALELTGSLPAPELPPALQPGPGQRPDFKAAAARAQAAEREVALARSQRWQDVSLGVGTQSDRFEDRPTGFRTENALAVQFSLPLPLWNRQTGRIREAGAAAERARIEAATLAARGTSEVATAFAEMQAALRLHDELANNLLPRARELEAAVVRARASGQVPLADELRARERRLELESARLESLREFHLARVRHLSALNHPSPLFPGSP